MNKAYLHISSGLVIKLFVLHSPYLITVHTFFSFSTNDFGRQLSIMNYGNCPSDRGWMMKNSGYGFCLWEKNAPWPVLFYSNISTAKYYASKYNHT